MNYERLYDCAKPRHRVWCKSDALTEGPDSGTYVISDAALRAELGEGSEIIVIDEPGKLLYWSSEDQLAFDWSGGGGGGGGVGSGGHGEHIYGVSWGYDASGVIVSVGTRTDEAAEFADPVPFVFGNDTQSAMASMATCGSPFDELFPWCEMKVVKQHFGDFVAIPKFWYKWTKVDGESLSLQVATYAAPGFHVSPAHMDRGDGAGEREWVYISRYKVTEMLTPVSGFAPLVNVTRADLRTQIAGTIQQLGMSGLTIQDYAMFWTWRMLYLVEYANWNGQTAIGYGCGTGWEGEVPCPECDGTGMIGGETCSNCGGSGGVWESTGQDEPDDTGTTDPMPYHTGTMCASIATPGQGVQYRHIEDPWSGVYEWVDGWRLGVDGETEESYCAVIMDPAAYSDTQGGVEIYRSSEVSGGWITDWGIPEVEGYDWALLPITNGEGDENTGVADGCGFDGPSMACGGSWFADPRCGPFCVGSHGASFSGALIGARLQIIP